MKFKILKITFFMSIAVAIIVILLRVLTYWDNLPPKFDGSKEYSIVQDENTCILRIKDTTGKESWIAGSSTKEVRKYVHQVVKIEGKYIYSDKLPKDAPMLLSISDDCQIENPIPYMLTIHIESVAKIPTTYQ